MDYLQLVIATETPERAEILTAMLGELPFDTFEEKAAENLLCAYIPHAHWTEAVEADVNLLATSFHFKYEKNIIAHKNWNLEWESNFQPIQVDNFVGLRANFHPPTPNVRFDLTIHPKMAFGTGHHETTYMMMQTMEGLDFEATKILDYGCGTGVLAILAAKLGATTIQAVDNEQPAYESTIENAVVNESPQIQAFHGTLTTIEEGGFDGILANINRNIILASLPVLHQKLNDGAWLMISGFMPQDADVMRIAAAENGFSILQQRQRGYWLCWLLRKNA
jgi:ribosomal protein L11 methyltransferase